MYKPRGFGSNMRPPVYGTCNGYDRNKLLQPQFKAAVLKTSRCVVGIVSLGVPHDQFGNYGDGAFTGSGTIIECNQNAGHDGKFSATILTTASLFYRPDDDVQLPSDIDVDVYLLSCEIRKGKVLACDFHYNLAVVNVQLDAAIQPPKLRDLDDTFPIQQPTTNYQSHSDDDHSTSFKIQPGDYVAALKRSYYFDFGVGLCQCSVSTYPIDGYNELIISFSTEDPRFKKDCGGPVINCHGEVIGILALQNTFIPSNLVSRWWNSYKNCKEFRRPWLGLVVSNLQSADYNFLEWFLWTFPTVSSGIIVKEVVENSPAHSSGLLKGDVIVQCNGAAVGSPLDFFEKIWGRVGESVELRILREEFMNVMVTVSEPTPNNFYSWLTPNWESRPVVDSEMSEDPGLESSAPSSDSASASDPENSLGNNQKRPTRPPRSRRPFVRSFPFHLQFFIRKRHRSRQPATLSNVDP